jgi:hypothetical protein
MKESELSHGNRVKAFHRLMDFIKEHGFTPQQASQLIDIWAEGIDSSEWYGWHKALDN